MSRIGNKPIPLPKVVTIELTDSLITVKGPKGSLDQALRPEISVKQEEGQIVVTRPS